MMKHIQNVLLKIIRLTLKFFEYTKNYKLVNLINSKDKEKKLLINTI